ncbi:glucose-6-phosphate exchanger SLC37A1-like [Sardina pilchardus]|uniref:glucose-6-phosphate exchanger SLC37A1-like n=1 Tax=Sardina pilchardus TaxID=27697 RepID=UPI002E152875
MSGVQAGQVKGVEVVGPDGPVVGVAGEDLVLPCFLRPNTSAVDMDVVWMIEDKSNYKQLLGAMDYSFLCAYAVGMYLSGIIGERLPIRLYLTVGMITSGLFTCLFGFGYIYNIHSLGFYIFIQVANGLVQTTGWPSVVTCIGNWFGKGRG